MEAFVDCICCRSKPVAPIKSCGMCFEEGARKRMCCNAVFCDHCYTKDKVCPNCGTSTKQEKLTGATFTLPLFSEHEECRCCLEPGLKRPCCSSYYCDECYYGQKKCRSCDALVGQKRPTSIFHAVSVSVVMGWLVTIFFTMMIFAFGLTVLANELTTQSTLSEYRCYGLFRTCELDVCIDMPADVASGSSPLPPLSTWKYCDINSVAKLESKACIFDKQLYDASDQMMGFDVCTELFEPGLYVLEDGFEYWTNSSFRSNQMKSGLFSNIVNGFATPYCGTASHKGGSKALTFSGGDSDPRRFAETVDLDISSGGWLELELFLSPIGFDITRPLCKTNFNGNVFIKSSSDGGLTWDLLGYYESILYRGADFFPLKFELPPSTSKIRFKFEQILFDTSRDSWAVDNVKVFRRQPSGWQKDKPYEANVAKAQDDMQHAQCCFDTDWCETRLSGKDTKSCEKLPWYHSKQYQMRNAEVILLITVLINILKFIYVSVKDYLVRGRYPFHDEFDDLTRTEWIMKHVPQRFRPRKTLTSFAANVHTFARMSKEAKDDLNDAEGIGERIRRKEEIEEEKEEKRRARMERLKKKIDRRDQYLKLKNNRFAKAAAKEIDKEIDADVDVEEAEVKEEKDVTKFGTGIMSTDLDKIKRTSLAMLRVPIDVRATNDRYVFAAIVTGVFVILIITLISVTSDYVVSKTLVPYGAYTAELVLTSYGINFLALICDFKEIFWTLKHVVPIKDVGSLPFITIDRSDEVNSLFIGPYTIPMEDIYSINNFSAAFAKACGAAYMLGCFPFCIFSLILRNAFLDFDSMRAISPLFGGVMILRALLGPGIFVKMGFTFSYFYSAGMNKRESIGIACQAERTKLGAVHGALAFALLSAFIFSAIAIDIVGWVTGVSLVAGAIYGAFTAVTHGLPIHPWMTFSCFEDGVYLVLKRKEACPCMYWGRYCTDMHDMQEVFMMYTTEEIRFISLVKAGNGGLY